MTEPARRPLKSRQAAWAIRLSAALARGGASPNGISFLSMVMATLAGAAFVVSGRVDGVARVAALVTAAAGIQLRLVCNLLDGMVAVEGNRRSKSGEVWNDAPDRYADVAILVGAGYALTQWPHGIELGWLASVLAVQTAYVRLLGGAAGLAQDFTGPMAKPHRMAAMTGAALLSTLEGLVGLREGTLLLIGLAVVALGCLVTIGRRLVRIVRGLEAR
ncbi:MAG TPA: CDP-alcohol phosphatidyltransferase family protein [Thermoanaerobaculia bacterium]|nr:CDP-alcohol phosphatidyltransferase family protein [Thermoanaerobaculia bacterium]